MMRVLTDVFPAGVRPARDGWYLTRPTGCTVLSFARYREESGGWITMDGSPFYEQDREWRGLAFDPAGAWEDRLGRAFIESQRIIEFDGVFVPGATCE